MSCAIFKLFHVEKYRDLEIYGRRHSRSLEITPFDSEYTSSRLRSFTTYQSVDEVKYLEFESFHGVEDVDLSVDIHLLADDPAGAEQPALTRAVDTVDNYRRRPRGALCRTNLNHFSQLQQPVAWPRYLLTTKVREISFFTTFQQLSQTVLISYTSHFKKGPWHPLHFFRASAPFHHTIPQRDGWTDWRTAFLYQYRASSRCLIQIRLT